MTQFHKRPAFYGLENRITIRKQSWEAEVDQAKKIARGTEARFFTMIAKKHRSPINKVLDWDHGPSEYATMRLMIRKASAVWKGSAKGGWRAVTTESGVLSRARLPLGMPLKEDGHSVPAELIAAAHAGSFSLALSNELGLKASALGEIVTSATVTLEHLATGWTIMNIHLNVLARLPKVTPGRFINATVRAKSNCLVSQLLRANVSMNAKLEK